MPAGRSQPQRLLRGGVEVRVVAGGHGLAYAGVRLGAAHEQIDGERERGGGRLVARREHGEELVAQLLLGERRAVLVAGAQEQGQDIGALVEVGRPAASCDLLVQHRVGDLPAADQLPARAPRPEVTLHAGDEQHGGARVDDRAQRVAQALDPGGLGHAEHRTADDVEGQCPHAGAQHDPVSRTPTVDLTLGCLMDDPSELGDVAALERGQQELALAQVARPVEDEHRVGAQHRCEERVRLAGEQVGLVSGEQVADRVGIRDVDPGAEAREPDGERVAVLGLPLAQPVQGPVQEPH